MSGAAPVILIVAISISVGFMIAFGIVCLSLYLRRRREVRISDPYAEPFVDTDHRTDFPRAVYPPITCRPMIRGDRITCAHCGTGPCRDGMA